jgi:HlyD family secretion protein
MATRNNNLFRNIFIIFGTLVIVAFIGKAAGWWGKEQLTQVATEKVVSMNITETVSASGKIEPVKEVKISPDVSGEIVELKVKEGDHVEQGQLLAKIRPDVYEASLNRSISNVNQAKAQYANAQQMLAQAQAQFKNTEAVYNRTYKLLKDKVVSQSEFDKAASDFEAAKSNIGALKQSVEAARFAITSADASVKESSDNLAKTTIFSPVKGTVSKLNVELGERVVGTSQMAGTELMRIANLGAMEAKVDVNENDINRLAIGDTAMIEVDAFRGRKFKAVVYQIGSSSNTTTTTASVDQVTDFSVKIKLLPESYSDLIKGKDNQDAPFKPGLSTSVEIQTKKVSNSLAIPIQAVTNRTDSALKAEQSKNKGASPSGTSSEKPLNTKSGSEPVEVVFVYKNGIVNLRPITTGIQDQFHIQILKGLELGDEVVTAPNLAISTQLKDGQKVQKVSLDKLSFSDKK